MLKRLALVSALLLLSMDIAVAQTRYQGHWVSDGELNENHLLEFAQNGHVPAITDAARRYLHGDGVERNRGIAWYWLKRAQQAGVDISSITPISLNQLLTQMTEGEGRALAYHADHYGDLNLNGIEIPALFDPLTPNIPEPLSDQEVAKFIEKFEGLDRKNHNQAYSAVESDLYARTAGLSFSRNISVDGQIAPFAMSKEAFARRKCNFYRAVERIFPQENYLLGGQQRTRHIALSSLFNQADTRYVRDVLYTGQFCPNRESEGISTALKWATQQEQRSPDALRALAMEHLQRSGSVSPDRFKPKVDVMAPEDEVERLYHYRLAKTLRAFAAYKERQ